MNVRGVKWAKGYVECSIRGKHIELFINRAVRSDLEFWDFQLLENGYARFLISLQDFFKLRPILKATYTRIHIRKKIGLPFIIARSGRRKGILSGIIVFFAFLYLLTSMIWSIDIEGNKLIKDAEVARAVQELGIHRGMLKYQLPKYEVLQEKLEAKLDQASWVGVKVKGTQLQITVAEKVTPPEKKLVGPQHIISKKNAVVSKILAEKGLQLVHVNDRVKKGDILISGLLGKEDKQQAVTALGKVEGLVWYQSNVTIPLTQQWKEYTGQFIEREYLSFGKRMIKIKGEKKIPFENSQSVFSQKVVKLKNYQFPVTYIHEKVLEYNEKAKDITEKEAIEMAVTYAKKDLARKIPIGSLIKDEKVLHQTTEHGKVNLQILFEVNEEISATIPIVQGE